MKILNLEPYNYSSEAKRTLEDIGEVFEGPYSRSELIDSISTFDVLIVRLGHLIDKEVLAEASNLKYILSATTGLNHIDCDYCYDKGIEIVSLKNEFSFLNQIYATSEHTWALLLSLIRKVPQAFASVRDNNWDRDIFKGSELNGKTIGIIGLGRIGKQVANFAQVFGMRVVTYTADSPVPNSKIKYLNSIEEVFQISDIVSIHLPLESETKRLIGEEQFRVIKKPIILINTSRGEIIDEDALLSALDNGKISAAAVDVLDSETDPEFLSKSVLIAYSKKHDNLLITPHIGGATYESMEKTEIFIAKKLVTILGEKHG